MSEYSGNTTLQLSAGDEYISRAKLQMISFVIVILLIPLFCLLGTVGNILSLVVLFHQRMRNQTNYILAFLSISDTLFLIHSLIFAIINIYTKVNPMEGAAWRAKVYPIVGAYSSVVTARITSWLTTLLCIERFIAVYIPMHAKTICSVRNTCIGILVIWIATFIMFIPYTLKYESMELFIPSKNISMVKLLKTDFYLENQDFFKVYGMILNILFRFAPITMVPILNILIIRTVLQALKLRRSMSQNSQSSSPALLSKEVKQSPPLASGDRKELHSSIRSHKPKIKQTSTDDNRITVMLLVVSFVFLFCILPGAINSIVTHILPEYSRLGRLKNLYICISSVTYLLETINSSVNFIIYMAMNKKFRALYKHIYCCGADAQYGNLSISSIKEKFRWSSKRASSNREPRYCRKTVSDIGPLSNGHYRNIVITTNKSPKKNSDKEMRHSHSEFFRNSSVENMKLLQVRLPV